MTDLDARIAELQADVDQLRRLEHASAELAELQAERARLAREDRARNGLDAVNALSQNILSDFRPGVKAWRARFEAVVREVEAVSDELGELQRPVADLARSLVGAVNAANAAGVPTQHAAALWLQMGFGDEDLEALPNYDDGRFRVPGLDERLGRLLAEHAGVSPLRPAAGIRQYVKGV